MRKALVYSAGLIGVYLVVNYATGTGTVLNAGASGASTVIRAFQGRG